MKKCGKNQKRPGNSKLKLFKNEKVRENSKLKFANSKKCEIIQNSNSNMKKVRQNSKLKLSRSAGTLKLKFFKY